MHRFLRAIPFFAGLVLAASSVAAQAAGSTARPQNTDAQIVALDSTFRMWTAEGRLKGKTVVVDSRPAMRSIQSQALGRDRSEKRPSARALAVTNRIAAAIGSRAATEGEQSPCGGGKCNFTPNLAVIIVGDPEINGDGATVTVGVSIVFQLNGRLRPQSTYQVISLQRSGDAWRVVSVKSAGGG